MNAGRGVAAGAAVLTVGAMVTIPLAVPGGVVRRRASTVVVVGLATSTFERLRERRGAVRALAGAASVAALGWAAESVGTRTGRPFGRYSYSGRLRPAVGGVPIVVPLAWFAMAVPARETAHAVLGRRSTAPRRMAVGSAALAAWDLFLDPQMVAEGYWRWARRGRYRGIPASNFGGWLLTAAAVMGVLELVVSPGANADRRLVGEYAAVATMETVAFAVFFRDRLVALAGGAAMLPFAAWGLWRTGRLAR